MAFYCSYNLTEINISNITVWLNIDFGTRVTFTPLSAAPSTKLYVNNEPVTELVVPGTVKAINSYAFCGYKSLSSVIIQDGVESIGMCAFCDCENLTSVTIPESVSGFSQSTFGGCTSLESINLPSTIQVIPPMFFTRCCNLKSLTCSAVTPPTVFNSDGTPEEYMSLYGVPLEECTLYVPAESIESYKSADYWKDFGSIKPIKRNIEITDGSDNVTQDKDEECASISYTRNFTNTAWQSLYVPFEIPVTDELLADFEIADLNDIRQYDRDDDGVKDETVVEAFKVKSGATLAANYPYLIRAKEAGEKTVTVTDATLFATEEVSIDCSSIHEKYTFTGTYSTKSSSELTGCYALCDGVWQPIAEDATLGAFRVYLKIESRDNITAPAQAIRMRVIGEDENDDATAIENAQLINEKSDVVYDLQGRRVANPTKGMYIVNGKKVMF